MTEVAEKVATDSAEELKKTAAKHEGEFPGKQQHKWMLLATNDVATATTCYIDVAFLPLILLPL